MNKFLYCFILILLLNQCLSDDSSEGTACVTANSKVACSQRTVSSILKKCVQTSKEDEALTCAEKSCDEVISGATEAICKELENSINKCEYIAEKTEGSETTPAHCKQVPIACTDSLGDVSSDQEEICSQRADKSDGTFCYFDGKSTCKEAKKCEDLVLSSEKTMSQDVCDQYNTAEKKCSADGNKCIVKSYCAQGKPSSEHDCSYYAVKEAGKICVLVEEDSTTKCSEMSEEEYVTKMKEEADEICADKKGNACTIIFEKTFFVECELKGEDCQTKEVYGICNSDDEIPNATNEQCSKLVHSPNGYCIKGLKGCIDVDSCESITGTGLTDALCKNFPAPSNYECVKGEGNKCNLVAKKTGGNNSSQGLTLSFAMLILILVI